ncbi:hypothetical protein DMH04_50010 [Kibdelosporangium aridum]|uniref:Uncharacterized protein n=1 Tax=Kibdelosporangium aridum TaxID=2030 RepID=A0A428YBX1_KIBAR|nr:hypothetical protein DMH04_50010 [Kibdelosporangium aridum]
MTMIQRITRRGFGGAGGSRGAKGMHIAADCLHTAGPASGLEFGLQLDGVMAARVPALVDIRFELVQRAGPVDRLGQQFVHSGRAGEAADRAVDLHRRVAWDGHFQRSALVTLE